MGILIAGTEDGFRVDSLQEDDLGCVKKFIEAHYLGAQIEIVDCAPREEGSFAFECLASEATLQVIRARVCGDIALWILEWAWGKGVTGFRWTKTDEEFSFSLVPPQ